MSNMARSLYLVNDPALARSGSGLLILELLVPWTGNLRALWVVDKSASAEGFTVDLYCSKDALNAGLTALVTDHSELLYTVIPRQTVAASSRQASLTGDYVYKNKESNSSTRVDKLYLVINVAGSGDKAFDVGVLTTPPTVAH